MSFIGDIATKTISATVTLVGGAGTAVFNDVFNLDHVITGLTAVNQGGTTTAGATFTLTVNGDAGSETEWAIPNGYTAAASPAFGYNYKDAGNTRPVQVGVNSPSFSGAPKVAIAAGTGTDTIKVELHLVCGSNSDNQ